MSHCFSACCFTPVFESLKSPLCTVRTVVDGFMLTPDTAKVQDLVGLSPARMSIAIGACVKTYPLGGPRRSVQVVFATCVRYLYRVRVNGYPLTRGELSS